MVRTKVNIDKKKKKMNKRFSINHFWLNCSALFCSDAKSPIFNILFHFSPTLGTLVCSALFLLNKNELWRKYCKWDFPTAGQDQTQPPPPTLAHFLFLPCSVSLSTPSGSCKRGVLRKTTHIPAQDILENHQNFIALVAPQNQTVCSYWTISRQLHDKCITVLKKKHLITPSKHVVWEKHIKMNSQKRTMCFEILWKHFPGS